MNIHFIKSNEKRDIVSQLNKQFGIEELPYLLVQSGKERVRAFSGHLSKDEIKSISEIARIEGIGMYLIRKEHDLRLSFDATQVLKNKIKKQIIEINQEQYEEWIRGYDLQVTSETKGTVVIKFKDDFIGCGKSTGDKILNHVPKERRIRKPLN